MTPSSAAGSEVEERLPTPPAQSLRKKEIGESPAVVAAVPVPMAASVKGAAGGGGSLLAVLLVLTAALAVAVAVPTAVSFHGRERDPMSQVWILTASICSCIFFFLRFIYHSRRFYTDFFRLSYGPLLASCSAGVIGSINTTLVLFFSMAWAAGNLGYSLAVHRLRKGTEPAIHAMPTSPSCPTDDSLNELNFHLDIGAPFLVLVWTSLLVLVTNIVILPELDLLILVSYFGWIHAAVWLVIVALVPMHMQGSPLEKMMLEWLVPTLLAWMLFCFVTPFVSQTLSVLCNVPSMLALVAFLWYNLAIYIHFLETATPSTTTHEDTTTL